MNTSTTKLNQTHFPLLRERWRNIEKATNEGRAIRRNEIFPSTYSIGARNKRDVSYEDGEKVTSRAVHMPDFHAELQTAPWIDAISFDIQERERGQIYIGNSYTKFDRLVKDFSETKSVIEDDVKRFDSSLYITDIVIAVAIARLYFDIDSELIDNHFLAIFDTVAIQDYHTPSDSMYRLVNGLPSGVKSTTLFGSLMNLLNLMHSCRKWDFKRFNFIVGGDDFLIASIDQRSDEDLNDIKDFALKVGIIFKILEFKFLNATSSNAKPSFQKYTINKGSQRALYQNVCSFLGILNIKVMKM